MNDHRLDDPFIDRFFSGEASMDERDQVFERLDWSHEAFDRLVEFGDSRGALFDLTPEMHGQAYRDTHAWAALSRASSSIEGDTTSWKERIQKWLARFDEFAASWTNQPILLSARSATQQSAAEQGASVRLTTDETRLRFVSGAEIPALEIVVADRLGSNRPLVVLIREHREEAPLIREATGIGEGKIGTRYENLEAASYLLMIEPRGLPPTAPK